MATLPTITRLLMADYLSQQSWIGPLLLNLNTFFDNIINALNKSLTIADNTTGDVPVLTLQVTPSAAAPVSLNWTKTNRPTALLVGNVQRYVGNPLQIDTSFVYSSAIQVQWFYQSPTNTQPKAQLQITAITGLPTAPTSANQYVLQLVAFTG
jgi:hypothetical protein